MSILKQKLDKASELFQTHSFKQALASYEDCIAFCHRTRQAQALIFNIMTTKAALQSILGDVDRAMSTLNDVLRIDANHYLALIRRSQVYKKKGKFNRALKDLEMVSAFCPDNLQVTAMKIEIQTMKSKNKKCCSSEQSESQDQLDEEIQLNFSNLKKIDRKSCSIVVDPLKSRKSRVTISGDTAIQYESEEVYDKSNNSTSVSKEQNKEKFQKTFKEIQMENDKPAPALNIVSKPNNRSKSILKNKKSVLVPNELQPQKPQEQNYGGRESRFLEKIKDIDGKMISSVKSIGSEKGVKEVQFRKSMFASQEKNFITVITPKVDKPESKKPAGRKSCLKRSSFEKLEAEVKERPVRKSKFDMLTGSNIDGIVIKNRKSIENVDIDKINNPVNTNSDDSDDDDSHNIFGSNENVLISNEIKEKLGIRGGDDKGKKEAKPRAGGGKSILKKNSVLVPGFGSEKKTEKLETNELSLGEDKNAKKPKKSVMFQKSRFAE